MAKLRLSLKLVVPFLILGSMLFTSEWIGSTNAPHQIPGGPIAVQAVPLAQKGSEAPKQYQTWQELAYLSVLFERLAHTYRGLEKEAKGTKGYLIESSGEDPGRWWIDPDPCQLPPPAPQCEWTIGEFAQCDSALVMRVGEVLGRVAMGIAEAQKILGGATEKFKFKNTKLYVPDEDWLKSDSD